MAKQVGLAAGRGKDLREVVSVLLSFADWPVLEYKKPKLKAGFADEYARESLLCRSVDCVYNRAKGNGVERNCRGLFILRPSRSGSAART